ncbi:MAG: glycosyltransferase [Bacteroidia bacterium]|nr:glycosyltransferase [Bacteroidia bacterium]
MAGFSIIVPSFNQDKFIRETLDNLATLKLKAAEKNSVVQIIVVDNCSDKATASHIKSFSHIIDNLFIEKDRGQFDAINKGLKVVTGDYWTWLNTDDLIDIDGFFKLVDELNKHPETDYIYGNVSYIDEQSKFSKSSSSGKLSLVKLVHKDASISQPGSFFRTAFTKRIGELAPFHFAFDYEYILRCLKYNAHLLHIQTNVAYFRYYTTSKSGSRDYRFLKEQLHINQQYGGHLLSKLGIMLNLRILKRKLFN